MHASLAHWALLGLALQDIKFNVHAHPTLSEVLDELFKGAHVEAAPSKVIGARASSGCMGCPAGLLFLGIA